jgi:hypothetical protein
MDWKCFSVCKTDGTHYGGRLTDDGNGGVNKLSFGITEIKDDHGQIETEWTEMARESDARLNQRRGDQTTAADRNVIDEFVS